ncbi:MAG: hypothetical protein SVU32_03650 [Candidatus Nanohaloarchaea archaeon]|nr:hypothetical protein [Candidatus Nanohaloarchaea archaeon]
MAEDDVLTFEQLRNLQQQEREKDTLHDLDDDFFDRAKDYLDRKQRIGDFKSNKEYRNARQIIEDIIDAREKKIIRLAFLSVTSGVPVNNLLSEEELLFDQVRESIREHRNDITGRLFGDGETTGGTNDSSSREQKTETDDTERAGTGSGAATDDPVGDKTSEEQTGGVSSEDLEPDQDEGVGKGSKDSGEDGSGPEQGASKDKTQDGEEYSEEEEEDEVLFGGGEDEQENDAEGTDEPDNDLVEVAIQEEVPAFMGVDMESYGPFNAGEEVMIPEENAEVLEEQGSAERLD